MNSFEHLHELIAKGERAHDLDLRGSNLADVDLSTFRADRLDLRAVDLVGATLCAVRLSNCRFDGAKLERADGSGSTLRMCVLDGAHAAGACFDGARIEDSSAKGANFTGASLRGTKLTETSFERAVLREAVFDDAEGEGVEFRGADLAGARLIGARLDEVDFRGANLQGADLSHARFRSADFRGALLDGARFDGADCHGARFDEGAGPHASSAPDARQTAAPSFDHATVRALRELVTQLPAVLATREGPTAELIDRLQRAGESVSASAINRPEEWKPWVDRMTKMANGRHPADLKTFLDALSEAPIGPLGDGGAGDNSAADVVAHLRSTFDALAAASSQPPEEWKPVLELLMKMTTGDRPPDLTALLDQLSSLVQRPPTPPSPAVS